MYCKKCGNELDYDFEDILNSIYEDEIFVLSTEEMLKIAQVVEQVTELMRNHS